MKAKDIFLTLSKDDQDKVLDKLNELMKERDLVWTSDNKKENNGFKR